MKHLLNRQELENLEKKQKREVIWQLMLSYDADTKYYEFNHDTIEFKKVFTKENFVFRVALLMILIDAKAQNIKSYTSSTLIFDLSYSVVGNAPRKYIIGVLNKYFEKNEFYYTIGTLKEKGAYNFNERINFSKNFKDDLNTAKSSLKKA